MLISDRLELIRYTMVTFSKNFDTYSPMSRRLFAFAIITELFQINKQLEELSMKLDSEIGIEDANIDFDDWLEHTDWLNGKGVFNIESYHQQKDANTIINHLTDYLPDGVEGYSFTQEQAESFKASMHVFCDNDRMGAKELMYILGEAIKQTIICLSDVKKKKTNIPSYLFEDYWYSFIADYVENMPSSDIYEHWKDAHDDPDINMLKDKQQQEILVLLKSGFFSHVAEPSKREIANSIVQLDPDAFDRNTTIPDGCDIECARLSKFVEWKGEIILWLNYEKLGRYIYKHHKELTEKEKWAIVHFDLIMDLIHEDMARLDPKYKQYLKNYEGNELQLIFDECKAILETCNNHLSDKVDDDFFSYILNELMYGDMKNELKSKLGGASKMTTLCTILAVCKSTMKVFKNGVIAEELAQSLSTVVERPSKSSLKRYIDNGSANYKSRIYINTDAAIKKYLAKGADNPLG